MKKYFALILSLIMVAICIAACGSSSDADASDVDVIMDDGNFDESYVEPETLSTVYLNSTRKGAITKAANPVIGIKFDDTEAFYNISKTTTNFRVEPVDGSIEAFYVMCDSPDEVLLGDFKYGFATALSTKWEDLLHIYDFEKNVVYKVATPKNTTKIKKIEDSKYAVQYMTDGNQEKTISFTTSDKYAYDLFASNKDVIMIVDGGPKYDSARKLAKESEDATTTTVIEESLTSAITSNESDELILIGSGNEEAAVNNRNVYERTEDDVYSSETYSDVETQTVVPKMIQDGDFDYYENSENTNVESYESDDMNQTSADSETADIYETDEETSGAGAVDEEEIETTVVVDKDQINLSDEQVYTEATESEVLTEAEIETANSKHRDIAGGRIINAPVIAQYPYYPTGCESVATTMAVQYSGVDITVDDFINLYLDKDNTFYFENGLKYGPSPYEFFIGSPYDSSGFGCMSNVIYNALLKIYGGDTTKVLNATGTSMEELCANYIDKDIPVIAWVNIGMADAFDSNAWYLADGSEFVWQGGEHCMLLVGYDAYNYYFNDPYTGQCLGYSRAASEKCYLQQGMQAVVILN